MTRNNRLRASLTLRVRNGAYHVPLTADAVFVLVFCWCVYAQTFGKGKPTTDQTSEHMQEISTNYHFLKEWSDWLMRSNSYILSRSFFNSRVHVESSFHPRVAKKRSSTLLDESPLRSQSRSRKNGGYTLVHPRLVYIKLYVSGREGSSEEVLLPVPSLYIRECTWVSMYVWRSFVRKSQSLYKFQREGGFRFCFQFW